MMIIDDKRFESFKIVETWKSASSTARLRDLEIFQGYLYINHGIIFVFSSVSNRAK